MFGVSRRDYRERSKLPFALPSRLLSHDRKPDPKLILEFFARMLILCQMKELIEYKYIDIIFIILIIKSPQIFYLYGDTNKL